MQALSGLICNGHLSGFVTGKIYSGNLKHVCVPGMNCYSCPAALGACPIGSMQAVFGGNHPKFAFYAVGLVTIIGAVIGRFVCGWLCLFGFIQELLYKIPVKKISVPEGADRVLRKLKYVMLIVFVVLLPVVLRNEMGVSFPYFCKWICPVGMLEGGIPLLILNDVLRPAAHFLYVWKLMILIVIVGLSMTIYRPFCKYLCPLGAFYGVFNRFSFLRMRCNHEVCTGCGACAGVCKMQVSPKDNPNSTECIRCGECVKTCPAHALRLGMEVKANGKENLKRSAYTADAACTDCGMRSQPKAN